MIIRKAIPNDYKKIAETHFLSTVAADRGFFPDDFIDNLTLEEFEESWDLEIANRWKNGLPWRAEPLVVVAEEEGKMLGFAAVHLDAEPDPCLSYFFVHPDHQRKGIGTNIAKTLANFLLQKGYHSIAGVAINGNNQSNGFYSSLGACKGKVRTIKIKQHPCEIVEFGVNNIQKVLRQFESKSNSQTRSLKTSSIYKCIGFFAVSVGIAATAIAVNAALSNSNNRL